MIGPKSREPVTLRLADIQGNILNAYGKQGFPKGRVILLHVADPEQGRGFITTFYPRVTSALRWPSRNPLAAPPAPDAPKRPDVTLNLAFTFEGLLALGVPIRSLAQMPSEFMEGMRARAPILGDNLPKGALDKWDKAWVNEAKTGGSSTVHIMVLLNSDMDKATGLPVHHMEDLTEEIRRYCEDSKGGVKILRGHGKGPEDYQDLSAILTKDETTDTYSALPKEHFGFVDGISDPVFEGQFPPDTEAVRKHGNGKLTGNGDWEPLATGEFLLGYPDEAKELPPAARPRLFSVNGTFMAYRKLEQKVELFEDYIDQTAPDFARIYGIDDPEAAKATLLAKFSGRWHDGVPLVLAPTYADWQAFNQTHSDPIARGALLSQFTYAADQDGVACPASSHIRRVNPRDALGPTPANPDGTPGKSGTALVNRRRILRRGLPYDTQNAKGERERGIVMLIYCASLERQFEFIQQQWLNYGMDNNAGNDTCPMLGARPERDIKFVIPKAPDGTGAPFFCANLPQFVDTKGGAYFFVPSMTCLRMIGIGVIDPT
jgi:Dyp-type peroxidase family